MVELTFAIGVATGFSPWAIMSVLSLAIAYR